MLDAEFHFTLDVAALPYSAKCKRLFTPDADALLQRWEACVGVIRPMTSCFASGYARPMRARGRAQLSFAWSRSARTRSGGMNMFCPMPKSAICAGG